MKKVIIMGLCFMCLLMTACSNQEKPQKSGEIVKIAFEDVKKKMDNKETFAVIFTQPSCTYCNSVKDMLKDYLPKHNVTLYEIVLDISSMEKTDVDNMLIDVHAYFPEMNGTPDLYYVKQGEIIERFDADGEKMDDEKVFHAWVQKYNLEEK